MTDSKSVIILDNGAATIKAGFASDDEPKIIPNCKMKVKSERQRQYIGDQIDDCKDCSGLYYILPHQKGFLINWDTQREIWEYLLNYKFKNLDPKETNIILTEPYFNFKPIQNNTDEVLFEEYGFNAILRTNTGYLSSIRHKSINSKTDTTTDLPSKEDSFPLACMIVDSGFSFTHVAPYVYKEEFGYLKLKQGVRRIDVGGKVLTNHLKEILSYRQIHVMEETYVINQCKEDACYVEENFEARLKECEQDKRDKVVKDYVLPDFTNVKRGYVRDPDFKASTARVDPNSTDPQFVRLANERFHVPEILFNPSDVGIDQVGIIETIVDSINSLPKQIHPLLYSNIVLTGGNVKIPGFRERILKGVRTYCPSHYEVKVFLPDDPITHAWYGGKTLALDNQDLLEKLMVTKKQYDESAENKRQICIEKFDT